MSILTIVIPAYNEEKGIQEIMTRVLAVRESLREAGVEGMELLVVNDGSKDGTAAAAQACAGDDPDVRIISHPRNRGYGAALKTGFNQAKGDLVGFLDADGTYPPEYFPHLCKAALEGADLVIGSRMAGAESQMPATRRIGNFFFANLINLLGWQRITDSASGMRVFHKDVLRKLSPLPDGLNLTPVMSTRAVHEEVKMVEVPIPYSERVGRSKLSVVRDGKLFLESIVWTVLTYNPVRVLGIIGVLGVVLAALIGLGILIARLSGVTELGPWGVVAIFTAMVAAVSGVSLFGLGATFNYLVSLFHHETVRQGLFGKPIFNTPLEASFGWLGVLGIVAGFVLAIVSLILGLQGWEIARLWFYMLAAAMLTLVGLQFVIYWLLMRVLDDLSQREELTNRDIYPLTGE